MSALVRVPTNLRDQRGAVMVEFIVVLLPLLVLFLCILELARFSIAALMMQRAAGIAARACAVIKDQPLHCDANLDDHAGQDPGQDASIEHAALAALLPLTPQQLHLDSARCTVGADPTPQSGTDTSAVSARFRCVFPLAQDVVCPNSEKASSPLGAGARTRVMTASAKFAHQGARYDCWYANELRGGIPGIVATEATQFPEFF